MLTKKEAKQFKSDFMNTRCIDWISLFNYINEMIDKYTEVQNENKKEKD